MQTRHKSWTAFASAAAVLTAIGCGDIETGGVPSETGDPSVETKAGAITTPPSRVLDPSARFFIPPPNPGAVEQIVDLAKGRKLLDAARITAMEATPRAVWLTDGSPADVKAAVRKTVKAAALQHTVPMLRRLQPPVPRLRAVLGGRRDRRRRVQGVDRRIRRRDRQRAGRHHPRARRPGHHPDQRRVVPADGHRRGGSQSAPGADPATRYALLNYAVDSLRRSARTRSSTSTARTAPGWARANRERTG